MKQIEFPSTLIIVIGSLAAFWLADTINSSFNAVGIMILLIIPVLIANYLFPDQELEKVMTLPEEIIENEEEKDSEEDASGELVDNTE